MKILKRQRKLSQIAFAVGLAYAGGAHAFDVHGELFGAPVTGSFDSTVTVGTGIRTESPSSDLIVSGAAGAGAPAGNLAAASGLGDQGDLNYAKGKPFTTYLKGTHELVLHLPSDITFMARASWLKDFSATSTTGYVSAANPPGVGSLTDDAAAQLSFKARLLDFWVSKSFDIGDKQARIRVGNQVVNWGESLFLPGGINATNAMDYMRLEQPGTQLKEAVLPAPMIDFATGLGHGMNFEAYIQQGWNADYMPPTGSYWSMVNGLGAGAAAYGIGSQSANKTGQYGMALHWQPTGSDFNFGLYTENYNDKSPNLSLQNGTPNWVYLNNRQLFGASVDFPIGDWAIGSELSYRPRDAVALNPNVDGCAATGGNCFVDEKKYQLAVTGMLSMTPGDYGGVLKALGNASTATLLAEAVLVDYPDLKSMYNGEMVASGIWGWGSQTATSPGPTPVGTATSWGYNFDFSWTYDGSLIPGWQVTPEVYYFQAVNGRTPNAMSMFMEGAKSANFIVTFAQNPTKWQVGVNYAHFWGGQQVFDQPYKDRDFVGLYLSRNI